MNTDSPNSDMHVSNMESKTFITKVAIALMTRLMHLYD